MEKMLQELRDLSKKGYFNAENGGNINVKPVVRYLGRLPDDQIASIIGVKTRKIRRLRISRGVSEYVPEIKEKNEIPLVEDKKEVLIVTSEQDEKRIIEITQIENDVIVYFIDIATDIGEDRFRARKSVREIQDAISEMYDKLDWHHILTAVRTLEKIGLIIRVNGVKKKEAGNGLHPKVTYQLNGRLFDSCSFRMIEKRGTKAPTYKRKQEKVVMSVDEKNIKGSNKQIDPREETRLLEKALTNLNFELHQLDEGLEKLEEIHAALLSHREALAEKAQGTSQKLDEAKALWTKLEELFKQK